MKLYCHRSLDPEKHRRLCLWKFATAARLRTLTVVLACILPALIPLFARSDSAPNTPSGTPMTLRYWYGSTGIDAYNQALLTLALQKTRDRYPAYTLESFQLPYGQARGRREISQDGEVNIYASPIRPVNDDDMVIVPVPIHKGLSGYRLLVVKEERVDLFSENTGHEQIRRMTAGLARAWIDADIFRHNDFAVVDEGVYDSLFLMLNRYRFDYIPLAMSTIQEALARQKDRYPDLAVAPHVMLYYPLPVVFQVGRRNGKIAERLEEGLKIAVEDGSFDRLFTQYHQSIIGKIKQSKRIVIVLRNPSAPSELGLDTPLFVTKERQRLVIPSEESAALPRLHLH